MSLDDLFTFGKHKGDQLEDVIYDDPDYIAWCCENGVVFFDDDALELISKRGIA